jgi:lipoyl(octanoyl) transferase
MASLEVEIHRHSSSDPWTYALLDQRQRQLAQDIKQGGSGALLLSELAPVITVGKRTPQSDLLFSKEKLKSLGVDTYPVDRGGFATYHGPGQWVLFIVDRLQSLTGDSRGVRKMICMLLETALSAAKNLEKKAEIREGNELGVWSEKGKFAAVGIHVEQGIVLHGLSVNGFKTSESFLGIKPCGLEQAVDFLLKDSKEFESLGKTIVQIAQQKIQLYKPANQS